MADATEQKPLIPVDEMTEDIGVTGTNIQGGYIFEEYNRSLSTLRQRVDTYDMMRTGDYMIASVIRAMKMTLLSAEYVIEGADEEKKEFIEQALFNMDRKFHDFLEEAYNYPIFGFYYFEKIFRIEGGKVTWKDFAPRLPKAHEQWHLDDEAPHITQNNLYDPEKKTFIEIPWKKLLYLVHEKEGDDWEGRSILRSLYFVWDSKVKTMNMLSQHFEKYGIGIPVYGTEDTGDTNVGAIKNMLFQLKAGFRSFIIKSKPEDTIELLGQGASNSALSGEMREYIKDLDMDIAKAFMAMFMTNGDNGVGTQAKSISDQEFFTMTLKSLSKKVVDAVNEAIVELIDFNFDNTDREDYPFLTVKNLDKVNVDSFVTTITSLVSTGVIDSGEEEIQSHIRKTLGLPMNEDTELAEIKFQEATENPREPIYQKWINVQEEFLQTDYEQRFLPLAQQYEAELREFIRAGYQGADKAIQNDTSLVFKRSAKNRTLAKKMSKGIDKIMERFRTELESDAFQGQIFDKSVQNATDMINEMRARNTLADFDLMDLLTYGVGYRSNVDGVIEKEGRQITESVFDNLTQAAIVIFALDQAREIEFNKNQYKLSTVTHPRAAFKGASQLESEGEDIDLFKGIVPDQVIPTLSPAGQTAGLLYTIKSTADWDAQSNTKNNVNVVGGLGLHHNDQMYFYPVKDSEIESEQAWADEQRAQFEQLTGIAPVANI